MYKYFFKRIIDLLLASAALIILTPLLIPVCIGLLLTGEHYIFYFQQRIGYKNRNFHIWKFATMTKNSPNMAGGLHTIRKDPRILPMGGFLRKTKINELPQLINILIGDMSIIGPRPLVDKTFAPYPAHVKKLIYNVKPGLTGIGSIVFRDEERLLSETKMTPEEFYRLHISPYKGELEIWYQQHLSFRTDVMLIFFTAWAIVAPQNEMVYTVFKDLPQRPEELGGDDFTTERGNEGTRGRLHEGATERLNEGTRGRGGEGARARKDEGMTGRRNDGKHAR